MGRGLHGMARRAEQIELNRSSCTEMYARVCESAPRWGPASLLIHSEPAHQCLPTFPQLEDQMTNFASDIDRAAAGYSPDRVDALVWAFSELLVEPMKSEGIFELYRRNAEAAEQRDKPQPTQTTSAIGSTEWLAEQKKSR
jgi:hypothetical protein